MKEARTDVTMEKIYAETAIVAENMQKYGGSFAKRLGASLQYADIHNIIKIKFTWYDLWEKYLNWGKQHENITSGLEK